MFIRNLKNKPFWLSFLLALFALNTQAQDPYFDHYTEDFELPSNQIYGMVMDENNILYMSSDKGLIQYDGYVFKTLTTRDGLEDNCILRMKKDMKNRIWLTSLENTCNYILNGAVYPAPFNESLKKQDPHEHYVQNVFVSGEDEIYITFDYPDLFKVNGDSLVLIEEHKNQVNNATICIFKTSDGYYWDQINAPENNPDQETTCIKIDNKYFLSTGGIGRSGHHRKELITLPDNEFLFSYYKSLFHFKGDSLHSEKKFDREILSLFSDSKTKDIWVGLDNKGALRFREGNLNYEPTRYLDERTITSILRDHEDNYWFATLNNGVYRANNLDFAIFQFNITNQNGNRITALASTEACIFIGTFNGELHYLKKVEKKDNSSKPFATKYSTKQIETYPQSGPIRHIFITSHGSLIIFSNQVTEIRPDGELFGFGVFGTYPYAFHELDSVTSILSVTDGIIRYKNYTIDTIFFDHNGYLKVRYIFRDSHNTFWFSSRSYGNFTWRPGSDPQKATNMGSLQSKRCLAFEEIQGNMLFAPAGEGILLSLTDKPDSLIQFKMEQGLTSDMIDDLLVEDDAIVWAATSNGLNKLTFENPLTVKPVISCINTRNGLPSNRVFCVEHFDNAIWAGTGRGLVKITTDYKPKQQISLPIIDSMIVNDNEIYSKPVSEILSKQYPVNLKFNFKSISYHQPHKVFYHYFLYPLEDMWNSTTDREIRYTEIGHGEYTLYIRASKSPLFEKLVDQKHLENSSSVKFSIPKKVHDKSWFKFLFITISLLVIGLIILFVSKSLRTQEQNKQRLLQAEKNALLAQMNPHFIFNSLNSIQHYIIQEDAENANLYLAKFAQLIRRILDNSKKKQISLREEIDTLNLYLNLEKLRFEDNFDFELIKSKNLDQNEIMIPPMLTQPFVENAIWHGLMPLKGKGLLKIKFILIGQVMTITIEDNGIGREKASKRKRISGHTPTGLKNVNERIALLNKTGDGKIYCRIIDLNKPEGKPAGTRVELTIPILHSDEKREK